MPEKILLWNNRSIVNDSTIPSLTAYFCEEGGRCPGILIIPGGSYGFVCEETEGAPIAHYFNRLGFHAFVLVYRIAPHSFPAPVEDAARAMKIIRGHVDDWRLIPDEIVACGFSAGGHLAGALGTFAGEVDASDGDTFDTLSEIPDGIIMSYPVVTMTSPWRHLDSVHNFCGKMGQKATARFSLEKRIHNRTPPVFIWHTLMDQMVSWKNSLRFAEAMAVARRPCELHLFPYGDHGMLLGLKTPDISMWPFLAKRFLETQRKLRQGPEGLAHYTHQYQCLAELRFSQKTGHLASV